VALPPADPPPASIFETGLRILVAVNPSDWAKKVRQFARRKELAKSGPAHRLKISSRAAAQPNQRRQCGTRDCAHNRGFNVGPPRLSGRVDETGKLTNRDGPEQAGQQIHRQGQVNQANPARKPRPGSTPVAGCIRPEGNGPILRPGRILAVNARRLEQLNSAPPPPLATKAVPSMACNSRSQSIRPRGKPT